MKTIIEALELADAALCGANMNMNVVEKKMKQAQTRARELEAEIAELKKTNELLDEMYWSENKEKTRIKAEIADMKHDLERQVSHNNRLVNEIARKDASNPFFYVLSGMRPRAFRSVAPELIEVNRRSNTRHKCFFPVLVF